MRSVHFSYFQFAGIPIPHHVFKIQKGAIVARAGLRSDTHLRERPRTKIKPCHSAHSIVNCKNLYLVANIIIYIQSRSYVTLGHRPEYETEWMFEFIKNLSFRLLGYVNVLDLANAPSPLKIDQH